VGAYQYPAWKVAGGKVPCGGQPGTPFLYIPDSGPADHAAAACGPRGTKRSPKLLSSSRISRRQSINAHARGLSKESSGIRQNDKSGRNPGPYENCFQSGFLLLPSFPLVHPGNSDFRTLPSRQASRGRNPGPTKTVFSRAFSSFLPFPSCTPGIRISGLSPVSRQASRVHDVRTRKAGPSNQTWRI